MSLPGNGIFVVKGEMSILMTAMQRNSRWTSHQEEDADGLMNSFRGLKDLLNKVDDLRLIEPNVFLAPFLDVIKSEEISGPVTSLALSAVNKFLSYGLIDSTHKSVPLIVHNIADAVTHARFVGTDQSSDGVVLMKILQVLKTLTLSPEGVTLTNESLCEIMLSCFRICFETRLNELLRRTAEHYLKDMVQLIFMRIPQFNEDFRASLKHFKMRADTVEPTRTKKKGRSSFRSKKNDSSKLDEKGGAGTKQPEKIDYLATTPTTVTAGNIVDMQGSISQVINENETESAELNTTPSESDSLLNSNKDASPESSQQEKPDQSGPVENEPLPESDLPDDGKKETVPDELPAHDYINQRGIRFITQSREDLVLVPYGLACVRELFRFLISLCNPLDKQNSDVMIHLGLTLLTVAFEVSADNIGKHGVLLSLVKDDLCRNLLSLLGTDRISVFAADLQVSFLLFESQRTHLKYQLESYLIKLMEIITTEPSKTSYEHKEIALDNILQLWRIPGFVTELYLNYDCDMYCSNLYEDLAKLLAKNAFSATSGVYHNQLLSLDALLSVIESIESHCSGNEPEIDKITVTDLIGSSRIKASSVPVPVPSREELIARKNIKKWLPQGTEYFNQKPKKGIQFLQEHGVLNPEPDPNEIALFLRENPGLDKTMIGEYLGNRSNAVILDAFVRTFDFTGVRIDDALRRYLETFRLPGEAPTISLLLETFAEYWHKSNNEPFVDVDSAYTLAYAIIMLNVDQHNQNAKRQIVPMSLNGFKKNLQGVNGGQDFDQDMLDEIYNSIKNEEIIMPAEQTGIVRDNYLWKVLLHKGASKDGTYIQTPVPTYDSELFSIIWAPILQALSYVFDRSDDPNVYRRAVAGFEKCASVSSSFGMTGNLDTLLLTLCKFTTFADGQQKRGQPHQGARMFASNTKTQSALRTVFSLCHRHGDNIREGWRNVFDLYLALFARNLLPKSHVEADDFIQPSGKITLVYRETESQQKQDVGLWGSLYSYMVSSENLSRVPTADEQEQIDLANRCIGECNLDQIVTDSKFLHQDSLEELVKALIELSRGPDVQKSLGYNYNESVAVFFLELLIRIVIHNRDRVMKIWQQVRDHLYTLVMNASLFDYQFLLERSVIGLLRIAIRLMRNEDMSPVVLQSLRMLLLLKSSTLCRISMQISFGLYELLKTSAQNIHTNTDWTIIFTLLECVGAGAQPPKPIVDDNNQLDPGTKSDCENPPSGDEDVSSDRGYTSDSELTKSPRHSTATTRSQSPLLVQNSPIGSPSNTGGWILVGNEGEIQPVVGRTLPPSQYNLALEKNLGPHDPSSLIKCCESLAFLVRDVAHITPYNFDDCVHCIRTFVEASLHGSNRRRKNSGKEQRTHHHRKSNRRKGDYNSRVSPTSSLDDEDNSDDDCLPAGYHQISIQLLDLMHTLHTRTAQIFRWWAEEGGEVAKDTSLWTQGWCPLLQGIARLCCDSRRPVRMSAITYLQRALLVHDLQTLTGPEWEACFHRVLFPLLGYLLQPISPKDPVATEETRMRAATVLSKVFLHHLTPLLSLPTFASLWMLILDFMDRYMNADRSDLLSEAIPESLKNMLLVMDSAGVFGGRGSRSVLWTTTWERINKFLPDMKEELFKEAVAAEKQPDGNATSKPAQSETISPGSGTGTGTGTSIILQPPTTSPTGTSLASPAPILSSQIQPTYIALQEPATPSVLQPTLQPGMPYMPPGLFSPVPSQSHPVPVVPLQGSPFPVLYGNQVIPSTRPTEVQPPVSLYSEYMENPYNGGADGQRKDNEAPVETQNNNETANFFQSSNYFGAGSGGNVIPPGSEILFGGRDSVGAPVGAGPGAGVGPGVQCGRSGLSDV